MRTATYDFCVSQINRLGWKKGFPKSQEITDFPSGETRYENPGLETLAKALQAASSDDNHAAKIVDEIQDRIDYCPTPTQIREVALSIGSASKPLCPKCGGMGSVSMGVDSNGYRFSSRCSCVLT